MRDERGKILFVVLEKMEARLDVMTDEALMLLAGLNLAQARE